MFERIYKHWHTTVKAFIGMAVAAAAYWGFNFPAELALSISGFVYVIMFLFSKDAVKE